MRCSPATILMPLLLPFVTSAESAIADECSVTCTVHSSGMAYLNRDAVQQPICLRHRFFVKGTGATHNCVTFEIVPCDALTDDSRIASSALWSWTSHIQLDEPNHRARPISYCTATLLDGPSPDSFYVLLAHFFVYDMSLDLYEITAEELRNGLAESTSRSECGPQPQSQTRFQQSLAEHDLPASAARVRMVDGRIEVVPFTTYGMSGKIQFLYDPDAGTWVPEPRLRELVADIPPQETFRQAFEDCRDDCCRLYLWKMTPWSHEHRELARARLDDGQLCEGLRMNFALALYREGTPEDRNRVLQLARQEPASATTRRLWFELVADALSLTPRAYDPRVLAVGINLLQHDRTRLTGRPGAGYDYARDLQICLGLQFEPSDRAAYESPDGNEDAFNEQTVINALAWIQAHEQSIRRAVDLGHKTWKPEETPQPR